MLRLLRWGKNKRMYDGTDKNGLCIVLKTHEIGEGTREKGAGSP